MRNVTQTAFLMAVLILISKLFGFIREMIIANFFGASFIVDAYVMASAIPGILFGGIFVSIATAYMPLYSKTVEDHGEARGNKFTSGVINLLLIFSICASIFGILFSDQIVSLFASGFSGDTAALTSFFVKVTFTYTLFSSIAGVLDSYLQYKGVFLSQIIAGYAQNAMIIVVIIICAFTSYYYMAFGMLLGVACRFLIVAFVAKRKSFQYKLTFQFKGEVNNIALLALPVFIGSSIQQISTFVDKTLASGLPEGSVAALNYAMLLIVLITTLTSGILTTIVYPKITQANSLEAYDRLNSIVCSGINLIIIIAAPCALGAIVYCNQIVQVVYERGAFDSNATSLTSSAFAFYAIGLVFLAINDLLTKTYYSMHDMKLPMIFSGVSVIIDIILNLILVRFMAHNGLALATSVGFMMNTFLLFFGLKKFYPQIIVFDSYSKLIKIIVSSILAIGTSWFFYTLVIIPLTAIMPARIFQLMLTVCFAAVAYIILLYMFKIDEVKIIKQIFKLAR